MRRAGENGFRLVLFDVDGTLIDCGGQPKPLFAEALVEVFGSAGDIARYRFTGRTDPRIVFDLMTGAGIDPVRVIEELPRLRDRYLARLAARLDPARVRVLPSVEELLADLASREDLSLGLLTGNWEEGAKIKLGSVGLDRFFRFGAFGDDQIDRRDLPPVALLRAGEATGRSFLPEETLIVGDSPLDIECARAHHIPCWAVATGWTPAEELARAGADRVLRDLGEWAQAGIPGADEGSSPRPR